MEKSNIEWVRLHPNWTYKIWGSYESRELIRTKYNWLLEKYDSYKHPIQRVDFARYVILYEYGGVYSDLDLYPVVNIEKYINGNVEVYFAFSSMSSANSFIASSKGANIWKNVFKNLESVKLPFWTRFTKHFNVLMSTGPMLVNKTIMEYGEATIGRLPAGFMNHEKKKWIDETPILVALPGMSWCSYDSRIFNFIMENLKLLAFLGVVFVILIIILIIYLIYRYVEFKKLLKRCMSFRK